MWHWFAWTTEIDQRDPARREQDVRRIGATIGAAGVVGLLVAAFGAGFRPEVGVSRVIGAGVFFSLCVAAAGGLNQRRFWGVRLAIAVCLAQIVSLRGTREAGLFAGAGVYAILGQELGLGIGAGADVRLRGPQLFAPASPGFLFDAYVSLPIADLPSGAARNTLQVNLLAGWAVFVLLRFKRDLA